MGARTRTAWVLALATVALVALAAGDAQAQWVVENKDATQSLKFGLLLQPNYEALETLDGDHYSQNLYFRRLRLLFGGKISDRWSFFLETDSPNLGKGDATGKKNNANIYIQDAIVTYRSSDALHVDTGLILLPLSYNHNQSAAALLALDYGAYTFVENAALDEPIGRDYGIQLRGYPFKKHMEYRVGLFQGARGANSANPLRYLARVAWWIWEAQTGYYYPGTLHGAKKAMQIGASYDAQRDYQAWNVDTWGEFPIGKNAITFQAAYGQFDGGDFLPALPKQDDILVELGFLIGGVVTPYIQWAQQDFDDSTRNDETQGQIGVNWWIKKHNLNLKLAYTQIDRDNFDKRNQLRLQFQFFNF